MTPFTLQRYDFSNVNELEPLDQKISALHQTAPPINKDRFCKTRESVAFAI